MKRIYNLLILSLFFVISCSCPECDTFPEPLRLVFIDVEGVNLLRNDELKVTEISTCSLNKVDFVIKDYVVSGSTEKTHIEINSLNSGCISDLCCAYIYFSNGTIDTINYQISEKETKCCFEYSTSSFTYNGIEYTDRIENTIGAFEIVKE